MESKRASVKRNAFGLSNLDRKCIKVALEVLEKKSDVILGEQFRRQGSGVSITHTMRLMRALMEEPEAEGGS